MTSTSTPRGSDFEEVKGTRLRLNMDRATGVLGLKLSSVLVKADEAAKDKTYPYIDLPGLDVPWMVQMTNSRASEHDGASDARSPEDIVDYTSTITPTQLDQVAADAGLTNEQMTFAWLWAQRQMDEQTEMAPQGQDVRDGDAVTDENVQDATSGPARQHVNSRPFSLSDIMSKQRSHRGRSPERKAWSAAKDPRALVLRTLYDTAVRCMRREECDEQSEPSVEDVDKENQILPEELDKENGRFLEANEQQEVVKDDDKAKNDEMAIFFSRSGPYETSASDKSKRGKVRKFADLERDADIGWEWQPGPGGEILFPRAATPEPEPERPAKRLRLSSSHRALRTISMLPKESQDIEMPGIMGLNGFVVDTTRVFGDDAVDIDFNFDVDNDVYGGGVSAAEACRSPDVPPASVEGSTLTRARRGRAPLATTFLEA